MFLLPLSKYFFLYDIYIMHVVAGWGCSEHHFLVLRNFAEIYWTTCVGKDSCWYQSGKVFFIRPKDLRTTSFPILLSPERKRAMQFCEFMFDL